MQVKIKDLPIMEAKRRPTLDELKEMPPGLLAMEVAQLCVDAAIAGQQDILTEAESMMLSQPQPEAIVELWNRLRCASGSTEAK